MRQFFVSVLVSCAVHGAHQVRTVATLAASVLVAPSDGCRLTWLLQSGIAHVPTTSLVRNPGSWCVGWQRHCETCRSLRELDNPVHFPPPPFFFFFFWWSLQLAVELDHLCGVGNLTPRKRGMIGSCHVYGKAPVMQLHSMPIAVSGSGHTGKQIYSFDAVIHMQESPPHKRFLVGCSSPSMRLVQHLPALGAWCKQCLPGR